MSKPNPDWITIEGPLRIDRRKVSSGRWVSWCHDNDVQVMHQRFGYMADLLSRDASEFDALRLVQIEGENVLSSGLFGKAAEELVKGILPE